MLARGVVAIAGVAEIEYQRGVVVFQSPPQLRMVVQETKAVAVQCFEGLPQVFDGIVVLLLEAVAQVGAVGRRGSPSSTVMSVTFSPCRVDGSELFGFRRAGDYTWDMPPTVR